MSHNFSHPVDFDFGDKNGILMRFLTIKLAFKQRMAIFVRYYCKIWLIGAVWILQLDINRHVTHNDVVAAVFPIKIAIFVCSIEHTHTTNID